MMIRVGDSGAEVLEVKNKLRQAGLFSGPDDDYFGEDLAEAVRAYQTSHGLTIDGVVGDETWGNINGDPNYPNNSTGKMGATSPGSGTGQPADYDALKQKFPQFAHLIDNPEIGPVLRDSNARALTNNPMSASEFESRIMATQWWKTTSSTARNYYNQQFSDPATFQNQIRDRQDQVRAIGGQLGYDESILTQGYIDQFAHRAYREGLTPAQIKAMMADEITPLAGTTERSTTLRDLRNVSQSYGFVTDTNTQNYWLREIGAGRQSIESFEGVARAWATSLFPHLGNMFQGGMSFRDIQKPYKDIIEKELELAPEQVDFIGDTKWRNVLDYVDPKDGVHRTMSMRELTEYVRRQPEWRKTKNGRENVAEVGEQLLRSFGAVA